MANTPPNLRASGTIRPSRFVKISGVHTGAEADANEDAIGISYQDGKYPPLNDLVTTNNHAENGDPIRLYGEGDICLLTLGGSVTAGNQIKSDADGQGVAASSAGDKVRAVALESGSSGEKRLVQIVRNSIHS